MQYASGGELYDYVSFHKALSDSEARRVFRQVATAIYYCHKVDSHQPLTNIGLIVKLYLSRIKFVTVILN